MGLTYDGDAPTSTMHDTKKKRGKESKRLLEKILSSIRKTISSWMVLAADLRRSGLPGISAVFVGTIAVGSILVFLVERSTNGQMFRNLFDAVWWALVTIATVGYGDMYPSSPAGRLWAMGLIMVGVVVTSVLSGAVASLLVERRIREGKGLQDVVAKGHIVICGWNGNAPSVLEGLAASRVGKSPVVLVNALDADSIDAVRASFPSMDVRFVRGDFTNEAVLRRASVGQAKTAIIIPDSSLNGNLAGADERTVMGALALRGLNPDLLIGAELLSSDNEVHLKRAGVSDVMVAGTLSGYLLSASADSPGVPLAARELITPSSKYRLREEAIPGNLVGKEFAEASQWFLRNGKGVLVGILSREKSVSFVDLLSDDSSAIDAFIRKKFQEAEIDITEATGSGEQLHLAPPPDYRIREDDAAFVVG